MYAYTAGSIAFHINDYGLLIVCALSFIYFLPFNYELFFFYLVLYCMHFIVNHSLAARKRI